MKKNIKAQIQMSETIAVLFIFFVLILFGLIFYTKYSQISFEEKREELTDRQAIDVSLKTLFLPELICSQQEAEPTENCLDLMKLEAASKTFSKYRSEYYFNLFPFVNITAVELYPEERQWGLYDKQKVKQLENGSLVKDWTNLKKTYFVVALRNETKEKEKGGEYSFGFLEIGVYS